MCSKYQTVAYNMIVVIYISTNYRGNLVDTNKFYELHHQMPIAIQYVLVICLIYFQIGALSEDHLLVTNWYVFSSEVHRNYLKSETSSYKRTNKVSAVILAHIHCYFTVQLLTSPRCWYGYLTSPWHRYNKN